ncbi:MAG: hypothetical protein AAB845_01070, partial [Patescibacteria group bacterium]
LSEGVTSAGARKKSSFDTGFVFAVILITIIIVVWGGIRYFMSTTDRQITSLETDITAADADLRGEKVDRILAFDTRRNGIETSAKANEDVAKRLTDLEGLVIPSIRLTEYSFNHNDGEVVVSGVTSDYKFLAQQLISLKKQAEYGSMRVDKIANTESGDISFTLKADTLSQ